MRAPIDGVFGHRERAHAQGCAGMAVGLPGRARAVYRSTSEKIAIFFTSVCLRAHHSSRSMAGRVIFPTGLRKRCAFVSLHMEIMWSVPRLATHPRTEQSGQFRGGWQRSQYIKSLIISQKNHQLGAKKKPWPVCPRTEPGLLCALLCPSCPPAPTRLAQPHQRAASPLPRVRTAGVGGR